MLHRRPPAPPVDLLARCQATIPEQAKPLPLSGRPLPERGSVLRFAAIAAASSVAFSLWFTAPGMRGWWLDGGAASRSVATPLLAAAEKATARADYIRIEGRALTPVRPTRAGERVSFRGPWYRNQFVCDRRYGSYTEVHWDTGTEQRLVLRNGRSYWRRGNIWKVIRDPAREPVNPALITAGASPQEILNGLFPGQSIRNVTRSVTFWKGRPAERFAFMTAYTGPIHELSREGIALFIDPGSRRLMAVRRFVVRGDSWDEMFAEFELFYDRRTSDTVLFDVAQFTAGARQQAR